jgi:hypothetical protein
VIERRCRIAANRSEVQHCAGNAGHPYRKTRQGLPKRFNVFANSHPKRRAFFPAFSAIRAPSTTFFRIPLDGPRQMS